MREVKILVRFEDKGGVLCWEIDFSGEESVSGHLSGLNVVIDSPLGTFRRSFIVALIENAIC